MRAVTVFVAVVTVAAPVRAEWSYQDGPDAGRHVAYVCSDGQGSSKGERLCFGLACSAGTPMAFGLSAEGDADLLARGDLSVLAFIGPHVTEPMSFVSTGLGTFEAAMTAEHAPVPAWLKAGSAVDLIYWTDDEAPPVRWSFSLKGSRDALTALEAVCPVPPVP